MFLLSDKEDKEMLRRFLNLKFLDSTTSLYHYTRCSSAQDILRSHTLYATNTEFLNDVNEMQYILSVLDEVMNEIGVASWREKIRHLIYDNLDEFHKYEYYVVSFSTSPDSLTLWSEFGDKTGYNMEFDGLKMRDMIMRNTRIFCDGFVIYDRAEQKNCLRRLIVEQIPHELSRSFGDILDTYLPGSNPIFEEYKLTLQKTIALYALFFKQTAFASEKEYRFVFRNPPNQVYFREQNGFLLPYIVIDCSADAKLPVKSVTVAPKNHIDLARRGMEYYLSSLGYNVPVKLSQLKLRY